VEIVLTMCGAFPGRDAFHHLRHLTPRRSKGGRPVAHRNEL